MGNGQRQLLFGHWIPLVQQNIWVDYSLTRGDKEGNEFDVAKKLYKEPKIILTTSEDGGRLKGQRL